MGLLEKLWDETLAGPQPDSGLGRLRRHTTFNFRSLSGKEDDGGNGRSNGEKTIVVENAEEMRVTKSITILKSPRSTGDSNSPSSPFSGILTAGKWRPKTDPTTKQDVATFSGNVSRKANRLVLQR